MSCTAEDYEAAARAICAAMELDAQTRKRNGSRTYGALLPPSEFHDRCQRLAGRIATERGFAIRRADADRSLHPVDGDA